MIVLVFSMVVMERRGYGGESVEGIRVCIEQIRGGAVAVSEETGATGAGRADAVQELQVRWLLHIE